VLIENYLATVLHIFQSETEKNLKIQYGKSHILPSVSLVRKVKNELGKLHIGLTKIPSNFELKLSYN